MKFYTKFYCSYKKYFNNWPFSNPNLNWIDFLIVCISNSQDGTFCVRNTPTVVWCETSQLDFLTKKNKNLVIFWTNLSLGVGIGQRPWVPILLAFLIMGGCAGGLYFFDEETAPENLWVPDNSQAVEDKKWVDEHFPGVLRFNNYIAVADNVLTPEFLQAVGFMWFSNNSLSLKKNLSLKKYWWHNESSIIHSTLVFLQCITRVVHLFTQISHFLHLAI